MNNLIKSVHTLILFTSGQCMLFDEKGEQIAPLQLALQDSSKNIPLLKQCVGQAEVLKIGCWREWIQELTLAEFIIITHLDCI